MARHLTSFAEIALQYDTLFCDLWGCVHDGQTALSGAVAALQNFRQGGGTVIFVTNSPRPATAVTRQLDRFGVPRDTWDAIATSGDAAQLALVTGAVGQKVWHIGPEKDLSFFTELADGLPPSTIERVPFEEAEGIVCTDLFDNSTESPEDYRGRLMLAQQRRLRMLCANPDIAVDVAGRRQWCAGALGQLYTELGGEVLYFGKPHPPIYDLARRQLQLLQRDPNPERILCIGDGIKTDILGAAGEGLDALFLTGGLDAGKFGPDIRKPEPAMVEDYLAGAQANPAYVMGLLE